jgi:hypothetical protein
VAKSVTVTVHVVELLPTKVCGLHVTVVLVPSWFVGLNVMVPPISV